MRTKKSKTWLQKWKNEAHRQSLYHRNPDRNFVMNKLIECGLSASEAEYVVNEVDEWPKPRQQKRTSNRAPVLRTFCF